MVRIAHVFDPVGLRAQPALRLCGSYLGPSFSEAETSRSAR